jgi:cellulose synthase/poly-beta-1,6-N-acetylglucosamine synthase-like glycosyltransferase
MTIIYTAGFFLFAYSILLFYYKIQWDVTEEKSLEKSFKPKTKISIIIPARNEEDNIGRLLDSILEQNYPEKLFEIIVIDDFSTDKTASIIKLYDRVRYFHLQEWVDDSFSNSFKKKAITEAIGVSKGKLIVTTDADCKVGKNWLQAIAQEFENNQYKAMAGPVMFFEKQSLLNIFQELDFIAMQGITAAVLSSKKGAMCNGANFIYTKQAFNEVKGYSGIDHLASGDDMMLMHKFASNFPEEIAYLKNADAIVHTNAMTSMGDFVQQRIRWAGKNKSLSDTKIKLVLLLSWLMNVAIIASWVSLFWASNNLLFVILLLIIKGVAEYFFCGDVAQFFNRKKRLPFLFILQPIHIFYMTFVGFLGMFNTYTWKQRKVK